MDGPLGEEPGFRGYALPLLQASRPPLLSAAILGLLVTLWHLPLVLFSGLSPIGLPTTFAITFLYVWLFNRTGGSVLLTLLFHNSQGTFTVGSFGFTGRRRRPRRADLLRRGRARGAGHRAAGPPGLAQGTPLGHRRRAFSARNASHVNDGGWPAPGERRRCSELGPANPIHRRKKCPHR